MIERNILSRITALMKQFPAVALVGARQIGKSTLAKQIAGKRPKRTAYFDLEKTSDKQKLSDVETILTSLKNNLVVIDEAQTLPELFTVLRPLIDEYRQPGRFLLLGSVSPHLVKNVSETLAGRIAYLELPPVNLQEAIKNKISMQRLWFRGGYPEALTLKTDEQWSLWTENYYRTFAERDVNILMKEALSSALVKNLWSMLSGINGNILNYEMLSRSLGVSRVTVLKYLDFLEGAFLIHRLQPWFINTSKRIVKSPKIYFRDSGMLHYLNRLRHADDLHGHIIAGSSWEGFVIEQIRQLAPSDLSLYYYRTHHGAETDLILVKGIQPIASVEIKLSNAPQITKGFFHCIDDLKIKRNFVITPASDEYRVKNSIVCSLERFLKKHLPSIK